MTSPLPDAADVLRALQGQFSLRGASADAAMTAVEPFLEARDAEIGRLNERLAGLAVTLRDLLDEDGSEEGERDG